MTLFVPQPRVARASLVASNLGGRLGGTHGLDRLGSDLSLQHPQLPRPDTKPLGPTTKPLLEIELPEQLRSMGAEELL